VARFMVV
jgi:hypothetical protein